MNAQTAKTASHASSATKTVKPGHIGYFKGDKIRFTGESDVYYGGLFFTAVYVEGARKDQICSIAERLVY